MDKSNHRRHVRRARRMTMRGVTGLALRDGWQPDTDSSFVLIRHGVAVATVDRGVSGLWIANPGGSMVTAVEAMQLAASAVSTSA